MFRVLLHLWKQKSVNALENNKIKALILFVALFWFSASGYLYFELPANPELCWKDAVWWTLVTMTTVGYGDYYPVTSGGRYIIGIPTMIFGIGFLGFIISEVAAGLIESQSKRIKGMTDIKEKNHILIINFSRMEQILKLIHELKTDISTSDRAICLIDEDLDELPKELIEEEILFVKGNPTNERVLSQANIAEASHAIILAKDPGDPHSDDQNLSTTLVIEDMAPNIFSITEVVDPAKTRQIEIAGCDSTVCVSEMSANLIIQELQDPGVKSVIQEITSNQVGQNLYLVPVKKMNTWKYRELALWGIDNHYSLLGLLRDGRILLNCAATEEVQETDRAILLGKTRVPSVEIL